MDKILIIEDNDEINELLKELLVNAGYDVKQAFSGQDDYITKPFDMREVLVRVELQLKRKRTVAKGKIVYHELNLDSENHTITINGNQLSFTRQEFAIMELLMKHPDKIYSKQELYELAWEECYIGEDKTLNVHISNIRKKIKQYSEREYIETVWGIGFRLKK